MDSKTIVPLHNCDHKLIMCIYENDDENLANKLPPTTDKLILWINHTESASNEKLIPAIIKRCPDLREIAIMMYVYVETNNYPRVQTCTSASVGEFEIRKDHWEVLNHEYIIRPRFVITPIWTIQLWVQFFKGLQFSFLNPSLGSRNISLAVSLGR